MFGPSSTAGRRRIVREPWTSGIPAVVTMRQSVAAPVGGKARLG